VRQAIKAAGARLLFLLKYSPDLNPSNRSSPSSIGAAKGRAAHLRRYRQSPRPNLPERIRKLSQKAG
jgi:hypothetical protein